MFRSNFTNILNHFINTIGGENGTIQFYTKQSKGEMGLGGDELVEYKLCSCIILLDSGNGIQTNQAKQNEVIDGSVRSTESTLLNKYFYYKKKRYKIIKKQDINGTINGVSFYHYDFVEG